MALCAMAVFVDDRFFCLFSAVSAVSWCKKWKFCCFLKKKVENVLRLKKKPYLCTRFTTVTAYKQRCLFSSVGQST